MFKTPFIPRHSKGNRAWRFLAENPIQQVLHFVCYYSGSLSCFRRGGGLRALRCDLLRPERSLHPDAALILPLKDLVLLPPSRFRSDPSQLASKEDVVLFPPCHLQIPPAVRPL